MDDDSLKIKITALTNPAKITVLPDSIFNSIELLGPNFLNRMVSQVFIKRRDFGQPMLKLTWQLLTVLMIPQVVHSW